MVLDGMCVLGCWFARDRGRENGGESLFVKAT